MRKWNKHQREQIMSETSKSWMQKLKVHGRKNKGSLK